MRLSSVLIRLILAFTTIGFVSCASSPPGRGPEQVNVLEGELMVLTNLPRASRVILSDRLGTFWVLKSSDWEGELVNLSGHRIRVRGEFIGAKPSGPEFRVDSYDMLPIGGMLPVRGSVEVMGGSVLLRTGDGGETYSLAGPLVTALKNFVSYRVWVVGDKVIPADAPGQQAIAILRVKGYGVIGAMRPPCLGPPSGIRRDSRNR